MKTRLGLLTLALFVAACSAAGSTATFGNGGTGGPGDDPGGSVDDPGNGVGTTTSALAKLTISEIAVYQAVKVDVMKGGAAVTSGNAPIVANRPGLLRVFVAPDSGYEPAAITAELRLRQGDTTIALLKDTKSVSRASTDADTASTFNFDLPGDKLPAGVSYSVTLVDPARTESRTAEASGARWPADGSNTPLGALSSGDQLKVVIVPIQYNADGSGRLPDTSEAQLDRYRSAFMKMYPIQKIDVTVHAPVPYSSAIGRDGTGFNTVLNTLLQLRQRDRVPADVYYMGVFAPAGSMNQFCGGGCVAGLSPQASSPSDTFARASVGLGFTGPQSAATALHEVGHAHGRAHAPCQTQDYDRAFPYSDGSIGTWGYDVETKQLFSPTSKKDFMGYCDPDWVSDYTYKALFTRIATVNGTKSIQYAGSTWAPQTWRMVTVERDGALVWGDTVDLRDPPLSDPRTLTFVDAAGREQRATGHFYPYADQGGGVLLVPETTRGFARMTVSGLSGVLTR